MINLVEIEALVIRLADVADIDRAFTLRLVELKIEQTQMCE